MSSDVAYAAIGTVPFTPLCHYTSDAYTRLVLRVADALLAPYGHASSFVSTRAAPRYPRVVDALVDARPSPRRDADPVSGEVMWTLRADASGAWWPSKP